MKLKNSDDQVGQRKKFATGVWGNELYNLQFFEVGDLPAKFLKVFSLAKELLYGMVITIRTV